jgi:hypothetical protein
MMAKILRQQRVEGVSYEEIYACDEPNYRPGVMAIAIFRAIAMGKMTVINIIVLFSNFSI